MEVRTRSALALDEAITVAIDGALQREVAHHLGVHQSKVSRWTTPGGPAPSYDELARLEDACGRPRGFVLRAAGLIDQATTVEDAIANDPNLSREGQAVLVAAYRAAVAVAARRRLSPTPTH